MCSISRELAPVSSLKMRATLHICPMEPCADPIASSTCVNEDNWNAAATKFKKGSLSISDPEPIL